MNLAPTQDDIHRARRTIAPYVHRTPILSSRSLGERSGYRVWLKAENLQKTGSFKARGAMNKMLSLTESERQSGVVTASAGNHGQAVAYASSLLDTPCYVVMPASANRSKVAAVRDYGAEAILHGELWDDAYAHSRVLQQQKDLTYIHPFCDRDVVAGQATIGTEILEDHPTVEAILVPIGGGGLISGISTAIKLAHPEIRIVGVEAAGSANMATSRRAGVATDLGSATTVADGLSTKRTDPDIFSIVERNVDDLVTVNDEEIMEAIPFVLERAKLLVETAGAAAVAALLSGRLELAEGTDVVAMLCGGNFDVQGKLRFVT